MTNPIKQLRKLIATSTSPVSGTVSSVKSGTMYVVTDKGPVEVPIAGSTFYKDGDRVRIINGVVVGKIRDVSDLPVYRV